MPSHSGVYVCVYVCVCVVVCKIKLSLTKGDKLGGIRVLCPLKRGCPDNV